MFCHVVIFVPALDHVVLDISLFWFIAKHKGRALDVDEVLAWLHWLYDYT
jgi:hypothetical protein